MRRESSGPRAVRALCAAAIVLVSLLVFRQVRDHEFVGLDDTRIVMSRQVRMGVTVESLREAWTSLAPPYWHPLTTIAHMVDVELFGLRPGGHLMMNVVLHLVSALLLFQVAGMMTARWWSSGLVAVLFAVHPLHVESVAWAAERKDVLSTLFWMLALWAYLRYARRSTSGRFILVGFLIVLGLLAKPMLVTLPLVLLLLDFWPLNRFAARTPGRLAGEKAVLLLAALPIGVITWYIVHKTTAASYPLGTRLANATLSPLIYLGQTVWPAGLAVFYPHPESVGATIPLWKAGGACALLAACSVAVFRLRTARPWLLVGWLWYLITLLPVLGIVQNWEQARADRFTYLPLIGIFLALVREAEAQVQGRPRRRCAAVAVAVVIALALAAAARRQAGYWRDGETLFNRALAVTVNNWLAHSQLGVIRSRQGRFREAEEHLRRALALRPLFPVAHNNLAVVLDKTDRPDDAAREYEEAIRQDRNYADALVNLGTLRFRRGRADEAAACYRAALAAQPTHAAALFNLALTLEAAGRWEEAVGHYEAAVREEPRNGFAHARLGALSVRQGRVEDAIARYRRAREIDPADETVAAELRRLTGGD